MYFVDRASCNNPPLAELQANHAEEQSKWLSYKAWKITKIGAKVNSPASKWNNDIIRDPLMVLFNYNCAYCGKYTNKNNDGEVDHFLPKDRDDNAESIYSWDNYVWACHSCNNKKRSSYPIINPCIEAETKEVYFHSLDGRFLVNRNAVQDIKGKFDLTEQKTYINGKMMPQRRKLLYKQLTTLYLESVRQADDIFEIESSIDPNSAQAIEAKNKLETAKQDVKEVIEPGDFILLIKQIFTDYRLTHPTFRYNFSDFT